jgi:hydroxymethylpyrimidine pyrophosphatase-like HAD family hydrolase
MHLNILAFDFDGTLAEDGRIAEATYQKLEQARAAGFRLLLVTGRILTSMTMDSRMNEFFEAIVAEDGAVVYFPQRDRTTLPFGHLTPEILKRLNLLGIPLEHGLAIVASHVPHDLPIAEVLRDVGGGAALEYNRGAVMVMPPGATKGTGLQ